MDVNTRPLVLQFISTTSGAAEPAWNLFQSTLTDTDNEILDLSFPDYGYFTPWPGGAQKGTAIFDLYQLGRPKDTKPVSEAQSHLPFPCTTSLNECQLLVNCLHNFLSIHSLKSYYY